MTIRSSIPHFDQRSLLLFTALVLGSASATWAQSTATPVTDTKTLSSMFAQADKDGDKMLTAEEAKAIPALVERFAQVDTNGDGQVSEAEFMASMAPAAK